MNREQRRPNFTRAWWGSIQKLVCTPAKYQDRSASTLDPLGLEWNLEHFMCMPLVVWALISIHKKHKDVLYVSEYHSNGWCQMGSVLGDLVDTVQVRRSEVHHPLSLSRYPLINIASMACLSGMGWGEWGNSTWRLSDLRWMGRHSGNNRGREGRIFDARCCCWWRPFVSASITLKSTTWLCAPSYHGEAFHGQLSCWREILHGPAQITLIQFNFEKELLLW